MNCLFSALPETFTARERPAAAVTSVNSTVLATSCAARTGMATATVPTPPSARRNSRRDRRHAGIGRLVTASSRLAPLLLQLGALALQFLKRLQRGAALVHPAEATVDAREHIVVRGCARVERDRVVERLARVLELALPLVRPALLKERAVGLRVERERTA